MSLARLAVVGAMLIAIPQVLQARYFDPPTNWQYRNVGGQTYYLYTPSNIQAGHKYPIVLTMHGCCWDNDTSHTLGDPIANSWYSEILNVQSEPFYILAPQNAGAYQTSIVTYLRSLFTQLPIDTTRVIVAGFSMGASGTASFLNAYPTQFSAALAVAIASGSIGAGAKDVPIWAASGADDGYKTNHEISITNVRTANGDNRGPLPNIYGINPRYDIYPITGHGDAMEGLFGTPGAIEWALRQVNDGNHRPQIHFTQASPVWEQILPAATTSITATASASDNDGAITKVEFFLNGVLKASVAAAPYQTTITGLTPGDYILTATATDNGASQGKSANKTATDSLRFGIQSVPHIATASLPAANAGVFLRDTLALQGGNWPFNWTVAGGSTLPPGLALSRSGRLEGIPTQVGSFTFSVTVTDTNGTPDTRQLALDVGAAPANVVVVSNIVKRGRGPYIPWVFRIHEPYKASGFYGLPKGVGLVRGDLHPIYDAVLDVGAFNGATFIRPSGVDGDVQSNSAGLPDWLTFDISVAAKVHVAYPRAQNSNNIPSWLQGNGWTRTGQMVKAVRQEYYDYVKQFPAGTVTLGPNDGVTVTNMANHYLVIVEPASVGVNQSRTLTPACNPQVRVTAGRGLVISGLAQAALSVRVLDTRGRVVASRKAAGSDALTIPTASFAPGAYVVRIEGSRSVVTEMFMLR